MFNYTIIIPRTF